MGKLNEHQVREIHSRVLKGETRQAVAPDYGVTPEMVGLIAQAKTWGHLGLPAIAPTRLSTVNLGKPTAQKILEGQIEDLQTSCKLWTRGTHRNGYGTVNHCGRNMLVHRVAYMLFKGDIPQGKMVLHSCDNRRCVNPDHLRLGDHKDNMGDMKARGRSARQMGSSHGMSKFSEACVLKAVKLLEGGLPLTEVSKITGMSCATLCDIRKGVAWSHVTGLPNTRIPKPKP
jgi:hypothetical protein